MAGLDYHYIAQLVRQAQQGDSNAFAQLYAATYQNQYRFACNYLKDSYLAQDAVQETYITALKSINRLRDATLVVAWLNQINFRICYRMQHQSRRYSHLDESRAEECGGTAPDPENEIIRVDSKEYIIRQVMNLPFTESQVILLHYYRMLKINEIAQLMDLSRSTVKRYMKSGINRLKQTLQL